MIRVVIIVDFIYRKLFAVAIQRKYNGSYKKDTRISLQVDSCRLATTRDGGSKWLRNGHLTGSLDIQSNIVVELLRLLCKRSGNILTLRLLRLELEDGGHQLQDLVLDFAILQQTLARCVSDMLSLAYLNLGCLIPGSSCNCWVKSFLLGIVGDLIDGIKKGQVFFSDVLKIVDVQSFEHRCSFGFGISSLTTGDGYVVVGRIRKYRSALSYFNCTPVECRRSNGESSKRKNGKGLKVHVRKGRKNYEGCCLKN